MWADCELYNNIMSTNGNSLICRKGNRGVNLKKIYSDDPTMGSWMNP